MKEAPLPLVALALPLVGRVAPHRKILGSSDLDSKSKGIQGEQSSTYGGEMSCVADFGLTLGKQEGCLSWASVRSGRASLAVLGLKPVRSHT